MSKTNKFSQLYHSSTGNPLYWYNESTGESKFGTLTLQQQNTAATQAPQEGLRKCKKGLTSGSFSMPFASKKRDIFARLDSSSLWVYGQRLHALSDNGSVSMGPIMGKDSLFTKYRNEVLLTSPLKPFYDIVVPIEDGETFRASECMFSEAEEFLSENSSEDGGSEEEEEEDEAIAERVKRTKRPWSSSSPEMAMKNKPIKKAKKTPPKKSRKTKSENSKRTSVLVSRKTPRDNHDISKVSRHGIEAE